MARALIEVRDQRTGWTGCSGQLRARCTLGKCHAPYNNCGRNEHSGTHSCSNPSIAVRCTACAASRTLAVPLQALQEAGVRFCVAPYEADAQMAYLAKANLADVVITEDSDLLAYGCPEVLFKLDKTGECDHVRLVDLPLNRSPSFAGFDHDNFIEVRRFCITSAKARTSMNY